MIKRVNHTMKFFRPSKTMPVSGITKSVSLASAMVTTFCVMAAESALAQPFSWVTIAGKATNSGSANGSGSQARFYNPYGAALGSDGSLYVVDSWNFTIRQLRSSGTNWDVTTIAGFARQVGTNNGTGSSARFSYPWGIAVGTNGYAYVADEANSTVRSVLLNGTNSVVSTIAGSPGVQAEKDGIGSVANFYQPGALALDGNGNIYVADYGGFTIRELTLQGGMWHVATVAGLAQSPGYSDGTNNFARFNYPAGIAVDFQGNLYVADQYNFTIRKLTSSGTNWSVTTIAGLATNIGSSDGLGSDARFSYPTGVAVDGSGNVYVSDVGNDAIRKLSPVGTNWFVSTIGGLKGYPGAANGTNSSAEFRSPGALCFSDGNMYVCDSGNDTIRIGDALPIKPVILGTPSLLPDGHLQFIVDGTAGQNYSVQKSSDLHHANWTTFVTTNSQTDPFIVTDATPTNAQSFYRLLIGP